MEYPKFSFSFLPAAANILLTLNGDVKVDDYASLIMIQIRLPILDKAVGTLWYLNNHLYIILIDIWHCAGRRLWCICPIDKNNVKAQGKLIIAEYTSYKLIDSVVILNSLLLKGWIENKIYGRVVIL